MRGSPIQFRDFTGGLNTKAAPYLLEANEARDVRNVVSTVNGSIKKRNGNQTFASVFAGAPPFLTSLFAMQTTTALIATGAAKIHSINTSGTSTDITGAAVLTSGARWEFVEAPAITGQGPLYGLNGTDIPQQWTGTGNIAAWTATAGTVPNGKFILYYKNRVWVTGVAATPHRVYFSNVGNPRDWPVANVVDLDPNDGDPITGMGVAGPYLVIFKNQKIFTIYDFDTGANRKLSSSMGCVAHRSIVESPQGTFFLTADRGVYVTDGVNLRQASQKIGPTLDSVIAAQRPNAAGTFFNDHYYLSVSLAGTANTVTLDYDFNLGSWWMHSNAVNQWARWRPVQGVELYAAQAAAAIIDRSYVTGVLQDNGANYTAYWRGPWITFNEPYRRKRIRQMHIDGRGVVDVYMSKDFYGGDQLLKQGAFRVPAPTTFGGSRIFGDPNRAFGDSPQQDSTIIPTLGVGRSFSVLVQGTSASDLEVDSFTLNITRRAD